MSLPAVQLSLTKESRRLSSVICLALVLLWASRAPVFQKLLLWLPRLTAILPETISMAFSTAKSLAAAMNQSSVGAEDGRWLKTWDHRLFHKVPPRVGAFSFRFTQSMCRPMPMLEPPSVHGTDENNHRSALLDQKVNQQFTLGINILTEKTPWLV